MSSRISPSNSFPWAAPHESLPPSPGRQVSHVPENLTLPCSGTEALRFVEDGSSDCAHRNALIRWAMSQVKPDQYFPLLKLNDGERRFGAKFINKDGARCAVRTVYQPVGDHNVRLDTVEYRGPETSEKGVIAQVEHPAIAHESAAYSAEAFPARLPSPPRRSMDDPTQEQYSFLGGQSFSSSTPWLDHHFPSGDVGGWRTDDQDLISEWTDISRLRRQSQEASYSATAGAGPSRLPPGSPRSPHAIPGMRQGPVPTRTPADVPDREGVRTPGRYHISEEIKQQVLALKGKYRLFEIVKMFPGLTLRQVRSVFDTQKALDAGTTMAEIRHGQRTQQAKRILGAEATATDMQRHNRAKRAEKVLGRSATAADFERDTRTKRVQTMIGASATEQDLRNHQQAELAKKILGPNATRLDYDKLLRRELVEAKAHGVPVSEIRAKRQSFAGTRK